MDILQVHGASYTDDQAVQLLQSCIPEWLQEQKCAGRIRFAGITAETPSGGLEKLLHSGHFDTLQIAYGVTHQQACDYRWEPFGLIPLARELGIGVMVMRSTTSGVLQRLLLTDFPQLDPRELAQLAIRFVLSTPEVDCALVGMTSVEDVTGCLTLVADDARRIDLVELNRRR